MNNSSQTDRIIGSGNIENQDYLEGFRETAVSRDTFEGLIQGFSPMLVMRIQQGTVTAEDIALPKVKQALEVWKSLQKTTWDKSVDMSSRMA